jgi:carbamoyltransferase
LPDSCDRYAFMTFILKVKEEYRDKLGAITHVDGTARLHTVKRDVNATYYDLISRFGDITGVPVLLNTSFNNNCEPIVDTPDQAINCFLTTNLDYLVIGNYIIQKLMPVSTGFLLGMHPVVPEFITIHRENGNGTPNYKIGNTYNKKKHVISPDIYELLTGGQSGRLNIRQLFATAGGLRADPAELVQEIKELWNLRVINLEP